MATKYVSANRGSDTTGDGSAINPWKTITKAIGPSPAFAVDAGSPNTLYVEPGLYREAFAFSVASSASAPFSIVGDYDGAGFAAGGHSSPATGLVEIRAWSDDATPIAANAIFVDIGYDHVTVERIKLVGGAKTDGVINLNGGLYFTLRDCTVVGYYDGTTSNGNCLRALADAGVAIGLTLERCVFVTTVSGSAAVVVYVAVNPTDWSLDSKITNCEFHGPSTGIYVTLNGGGTGAFYPSGLAIQNCTFAGMQYGIYVHYSSTTLTSPYTVNGCGFAGAAVYADTTGQVVEDGNVFANLTGANPAAVAAGANSVFGVCPALSFGSDRVAGGYPRPYLEPSVDGPFHAFGDYGTTPSVDVYGQTRPATASAGALEIDDFPSGGGGNTYIFQVEA